MSTNITLKKVMTQLTVRVNQVPDRPAVIRLKKGLRVMMKRDRLGLVLGIARDDTYPSDAEWNTVTRHMPYPIPLVTPRKGKKERRYYLTARIPDETQMQLFDLADHG